MAGLSPYKELWMLADSLRLFDFLMQWTPYSIFAVMVWYLRSHVS